MSLEQRLTDWKSTFLTDNVQKIDDTGNFLSSESVVIFSGPPTFAAADAVTAAELVPIGLVQNASVSQGRQVQQIYEIGSRKPIMVPGRAQIQLQLSRVLFDGPSLAKVVNVRPVGDANILSTPATSAGEGIASQLDDPTDPFPDADDAVDFVSATDTNGDFWINLASSAFNKPLGLGFALYDMQEESYGGFYLENCYARNHNFNISAQQTVLAETMSFICTQLRPLSTTFIGDPD